MGEYLYDVNSGLIAAVLFVSMAAAIELGYRIGGRKKPFANEAAREHINGIQGSILGILALLLGFTFSLALQRFDSRSEGVVDEANAIGTAYLRVQLLPQDMRQEIQGRFRDYVDLRIQESSMTLAASAERDALLAKTTNLQTALWADARQGIAADPNIYAPALFVESVNQLIDSFGKRTAALNRHVPEVVLLLLFATFLMAGGIVGFSSGIAGHRPSLVSYMMVALIVVLVFIILDLDRPRRGLIQVSQSSMVALQTAIQAEVGVKK
jgi:Protein of unknown function (DUF4239)